MGHPLFFWDEIRATRLSHISGILDLGFSLSIAIPGLKRETWGTRFSSGIEIRATRLSHISGILDLGFSLSIAIPGLKRETWGTR